MLQFEKICSEIGVLVVNEKTEGPSTIIEYLGLTIDTVNMLIKNPEKKVQDLLKKIKLFSYGVERIAIYVWFIGILCKGIACRSLF